MKYIIQTVIQIALLAFIILVGVSWSIKIHMTYHPWLGISLIPTVTALIVVCVTVRAWVKDTWY